jgi:outer membrane protein assembly factor BamA
MCMYNPAVLCISLWSNSRLTGVIILFILFFKIHLVSQKTLDYKLYIDLVEKTDVFTNVRDSLFLLQKIDSWIKETRNDAYLLAGMDSLIHKNGILIVYLKKGPQFKYVMLVKDSQTLSELQSLNLRFPDAEYTNPYNMSNQFNHWIYSGARQGYPLSRVDLFPIDIRTDSLIAKYTFQKREKIYFHQLDQRQKKILENNVLNRITGIYPGDIYDHKLVEEVKTKLGRLGYVSMRSDPRVLFSGNEGIVWLYLEKNNSSRFDILLGLSPEQGLSGKKYRLTGEAGFELINTLKTGEKLYLKYENLIANSPRLKLGFEFPYIKYIPFGLAADLQVYRFGEQYIDVSSQFIISYPWSSLQSSGVSLSYISSTLLNPDSLFLIRTKRLPSQLDYRYYAFGIRHEYNSLDYRPNPTKGMNLLMDIKAGKKEFRANSILLSYDSEHTKVVQQYDSLNKNQDLAIYSMQLAWYKSLKPRHILKIGLTTKGLLGSAKRLDNELIRIGGYKNLRGFDEDFFKCNHVAIQTLEYRFLLDRNSYLNVFSDFALLNQSQLDDFVWNWYEGFGLGIQFQTKAGAFSLQYALGTSKLESIDLGNGKIHFGYNTLF